ncbi:MAG: hypothetical protein HY959_12695 [Ignavibacteriae bacterium]|nr:hypothetical protein [Ignavibacteriota bacterium]
MENYKNIIEEFLKTTSFKLIELVKRGERSNILLEVFIDKEDNFGIDEIAVVNRDLWKYLESNNLEKGISKIIISSPGADKPLKFFWQFKKHIGRELDIKTPSGESITGTLEELTDFVKGEFRISVKEKKEIKKMNFIFGEISEAKVKLSFKK